MALLCLVLFVLPFLSGGPFEIGTRVERMYKWIKSGIGMKKYWARCFFFFLTRTSSDDRSEKKEKWRKKELVERQGLWDEGRQWNERERVDWI